MNKNEQLLSVRRIQRTCDERYVELIQQEAEGRTLRLPACIVG